jgi:hypothetical protein
MKFEANASLSDEDVERIADAVFAKLKANATVVQKSTEGAEAPEKPATKPRGKTADKPKTEAPPADDGAKAPTQDDVQVALKDYAKANGRDKAAAILKKYAGAVTELSAGDLQKVIDDCKAGPKAASAPAEDDPF